MDDPSITPNILGNKRVQYLSLQLNNLEHFLFSIIWYKHIPFEDLEQMMELIVEHYILEDAF